MDIRYISRHLVKCYVHCYNACCLVICGNKFECSLLNDCSLRLPHRFYNDITGHSCAERKIAGAAGNINPLNKVIIALCGVSRCKVVCGFHSIRTGKRFGTCLNTAVKVERIVILYCLCHNRYGIVGINSGIGNGITAYNAFAVCGSYTCDFVTVFRIESNCYVCALLNIIEVCNACCHTRLCTVVNSGNLIVLNARCFRFPIRFDCQISDGCSGYVGKRSLISFGIYGYPAFENVTLFFGSSRYGYGSIVNGISAVYVACIAADVAAVKVKGVIIHHIIVEIDYVSR